MVPRSGFEPESSGSVTLICPLGQKLRVKSSSSKITKNYKFQNRRSTKRDFDQTHIWAFPQIATGGMASRGLRLCVSLSMIVSTSAFGGMRGIATAPVRNMIVPSGLCAVHKPKGCTSANVVSRVKYMFDPKGKRVKVGHGGTLDPMAEGVLILGIGEGTKQLSKYLSGSKGYAAVGLMGKAYDTLDITGKEVETADFGHVTAEMLENALSTFRGDFLQMPPMYSALKSQGRRLYDLAREGIEVEREARPVSVYDLALVRNRELPEFSLEIECSGGFYVRSLIADICAEVGTVGCMSELVRTKQAMFTLSDCLSEEEWTQEKLCDHIVHCNSLVQRSLAQSGVQA